MSDFAELTEWCGGTNTTQLVVVVNDETVVDRSWRVAPSERHDVGSIQKLLTGVVLAQLVASGNIGLDQPLNDLLGPGWSQAPATHEQTITISHLATMTAGLDDDFHAIHSPGQGWYYCNNGYHLLRRVLEGADGRSTDAMFRARIFEPCGMTTSSFVRRDPDDPSSLPGLISTGRDIARFGQALLTSKPFGIEGELLSNLRQGTASNPSYGHLVWRYGGHAAIVPGRRSGQEPIPGRVFGGIKLDRPIAAAIPADGFGGTGLGEQRLTIVPSRRLVIVRLGRFANPPIGAYDRELWARVPPELRSEP